MEDNKLLEELESLLDLQAEGVGVNKKRPENLGEKAYVKKDETTVFNREARFGVDIAPENSLDKAANKALDSAFEDESEKSLDKAFSLNLSSESNANRLCSNALKDEDGNYVSLHSNALHKDTLNPSSLNTASLTKPLDASLRDFTSYQQGREVLLPPKEICKEDLYEEICCLEEMTRTQRLYEASLKKKRHENPKP